MKAGWYTNIGFAGGSLTVAIGASDTANTSWRRLFMKYIRQVYLPVYNFQTSEIYGAMGALNSAGLVFTLKRNILSHDPTIVFVEEAWNDFVARDPELMRKAVEGVIRQIKPSKTSPDCVLIGVGCKPGAGDRSDGLLDHSLYRELADYYHIPFVDFQEYTMRELQCRGQTWESIGFDACHLNDYGQQMWFGALREWFDRQVKYHEVEQTKHETRELPPPKYSDEFQFATLINPTRENDDLELDGDWRKDEGVTVPWYFDNVLVGRTGNRLRLHFTGTAIGLFCLTYNNGLKIHALIDGEEIAGPFTNFIVEFGAFHMLRHGMESKEHLLELEVGKPLKSKNKLEDPTARIAWIATATGKGYAQNLS